MSANYQDTDYCTRCGEPATPENSVKLTPAAAIHSATEEARTEINDRWNRNPTGFITLHLHCVDRPETLAQNFMSDDFARWATGYIRQLEARIAALEAGPSRTNPGTEELP